MNPRDEFSRYYAELIQGSYDCVDRIVVNAYFPMGQTGGGMRYWWRRFRGDDKDLDDAHLREMAGTFSRRVRAFCEKQGIPLIETQAGERKHELAVEHLPEDSGFHGLFLVMTANAPAPVWEVRRNGSGQIVDLRHRKAWPYVKHYYFHLMDAEWGHVTIRMCGYPPYGAQVILNGHEWVGRRAKRQDLAVVKSSNCFIEGSDFEGVNQLAEELNDAMAKGCLQEVGDRWIYSSCLCFALGMEDQERSGFLYQYSVFQIELSRNFLFQRGSTMDEVYQGLIDRTRQPLDVKQLKTIFGHSYRPHRAKTRGHETELLKSVNSPSYDLTVFKVKWGRLTLKIYDKGERILRVEVVAHNTRDLRCGRVLDKLPVMLERMGGMLVRFLSTVQVAHISFLDEGVFDGWNEPTTRGTKRLAGINLDKDRNRHVVNAVVALSTQPDGFTVGQLAEAVRMRTGWSPTAYSPRHAAYDLAKLRGKELVRRQRKSRCHAVDPAAVRTLCAYLLLREKVIKPLLAGVATRRPGPAPRKINSLDRHYVILREELNRTFETIGLIA